MKGRQTIEAPKADTYPKHMKAKPQIWDSAQGR